MSINLFTTSDSPNIRIPILQIFVFVIEGGQENIFLLVENIFWTNEKIFSCPPSITKTKIWRIGIRIFGGSDVVNKLQVTKTCSDFTNFLKLTELTIENSFYITTFQKICQIKALIRLLCWKLVLYCKLSQFQKIREITAGHLSLGLDLSPLSFLMFDYVSRRTGWVGSKYGSFCRRSVLYLC